MLQQGLIVGATAKHKHWCGVWSISGLRRSPVLAFVHHATARAPLNNTKKFSVVAAATASTDIPRNAAMCSPT